MTDLCAGVGDNAVMLVLRPSRHLARLVLAWFVLAFGVAVASPLVKPQSWQMVCSASGVVKLVSMDDNGAATSAGHQTECPLCSLTGAPPSVQSRVLAARPVSLAELPATDLLREASRAAPPLPARGPPSFS